MAQEKNIRIAIENIPDLLLDEKEIRQLLLNLLYNGLESMPSGGDITIRTYTENENVVLSIQDQGHGIKPEILEKLGTPFLTTKENGTGLGLAVCYGIAVRHNANINIKTSETGTTFLVNFPISKSM
jgi:signal transduction histidine kinase